MSSDGGQVLYQQGGDVNGSPGPWTIMGIDGSNPTQVTGLQDIKDSNGNQLTVSTTPIFITAKGENQLIASVVPFDSTKGSPAQCTIDSINPSTGAAQQLFTYSNFFCQGLTRSPDGASVAFSLIPSNPDGSPGDGNVYLLPNIIGGSITGDTSSSGYTVSNTSGTSDVSWGPVVPPISSASCSISPLPSNIAANGTITPSVTITNTGNQAITPEISYNYGKGTNSQILTFGSIGVAVGKVGNSETMTLPSYKPTISGPNILYVMSVIGSVPFNCQSNTVTVAAQYAAVCSISNVPADVNKGSAVQPVITFKNTGNTSLVNIYETSFSLKLNTGASHSFAVSQFTNVNLVPGQTYANSPAPYTIPKTTTATSAVITVTAKATNVASFSCTKSFKIPA